MTYGLKKIVKEQGRAVTIKKPKMDLVQDTSGYGVAKDKPWSLRIDGKTHRRFKTKEAAMKYTKSYRKKMNKKARDMLKTF